MASPIASSDTSTARLGGMLPGRHSISISRVTTSRMPPSALTPLATPVISIGTLTVIFTSIRTRTKSMWRGLRESGSRCSSLIMACRLWSEPASFRRKIAFSPAPSRKRSARAFRFTAIGTFGLPAP